MLSILRDIQEPTLCLGRVEDGESFLPALLFDLESLSILQSELFKADIIAVVDGISTTARENQKVLALDGNGAELNQLS